MQKRRGVASARRQWLMKTMHRQWLVAGGALSAWLAGALYRQWLSAWLAWALYRQWLVAPAL